MADIIIKILTPATQFDLLTLQEAKLALGITDNLSDAQLQQSITVYSDVVSELTNRVFAKERVRETWRCLGSRRLFLSHWPIVETDIEKVECPRGTLMDPATYEIEERSGKIELFGPQPEPIEITYTGGVTLPDKAPPALKQATLLLIREDRATAQRQATSGIRSLSHKEARVMFFDPAQQLRAQGGGGNQTMNAVSALLSHYTRLEV